MRGGARPAYVQNCCINSTDPTQEKYATKTMQTIVRLPPGDMSKIIRIIQIRHLSALKDIDQEVGTDGDLSQICRTVSIPSLELSAYPRLLLTEMIKPVFFFVHITVSCTTS